MTSHDNQRIEALLERIAVALERLAAQRDGEAVRANHRDPVVAYLEPEVRVDDGASPAPSSPSVLTSFLEAKKIQIKSLPPNDAADPVIDSLSLFLGERYHALSSLLRKIKRAMQKGETITESLKNRPQLDVSSACQFCTRLHEVAFLETYSYSPSPTYLIRAKTTTLPRAQRFFGGQWLERFLLQKVKSVHAKVAAEVGGRLELEYLINPQIVLPNGHDFELDILAAFGSSVYWIEAKSGDYQQHVHKYSQFARFLGLDSAHSLMVLTDVPDERCDALSSLFSMSVCNLRSFQEKLLTVARNDAA